MPRGSTWRWGASRASPSSASPGVPTRACLGPGAGSSRGRWHAPSPPSAPSTSAPRGGRSGAATRPAPPPPASSDRWRCAPKRPASSPPRARPSAAPSPPWLAWATASRAASILEAEYFYNGGAPADRVAAQTLLLEGWLLQTSRHVAGLVASYDPHPLLHVSLGLLAASGALSGGIQPGLVWSVSDNVDVVGGALVPLGRHPTVDAAGLLRLYDEFGIYPQVFYVQMKTFF